MPETREPAAEPVEGARSGSAETAPQDPEYIVVCRELHSGVSTYVGPFPHRAAAEQHATEAASADPGGDEETFEYHVAPLSRRSA